MICGDDRSDIYFVGTLAFQPRDALGIWGQRVGKHFDGNLATKVRIGGAINLAHAAAANQRQKFIRARRVPADSEMSRGRL